jgi:SAM-dependent methyltransferase
VAVTTAVRYDAIGGGYAGRRREDPRVRALVHGALGDASSVVNVGAGTGSYEPRDRYVVAVEPSDVMAAQRPADRVPAIRAGAGSLPLRDGAIDAAMAILTVHHWDVELEAGVRELRRVARGPVVVLTFDAEVSARMWLAADYLPEVAALDRRIFPTLGQLGAWLGGTVQETVVPIAADTPDHTFGAFWAHPERVLDPAARAATSGFARMSNAVVHRVVAELSADLASGAWDARHGELRGLGEFDAGLRLVVAWPDMEMSGTGTATDTSMFMAANARALTAPSRGQSETKGHRRGPFRTPRPRRRTRAPAPLPSDRRGSVAVVPAWAGGVSCPSRPAAAA